MKIFHISLLLTLIIGLSSCHKQEKDTEDVSEDSEMMMPLNSDTTFDDQAIDTAFEREINKIQ